MNRSSSPAAAPSGAPVLEGSLAAVEPSRIPVTVRRGAVALLVGGPLSLAFHALWRIGHGPTVVNEHGVVLGLTNDQWSYLGGSWALLVAVGVVAACRSFGGWLSTIAAVLTVTGLLLGAVSAWVWSLYSLGALVQYAGMASLGLVAVQTRGRQRLAGLVLLGAVVLFLPVPVVPDAAYLEIPVWLPFTVETQDLLALAAAVSWTSLGWALLAATPHATGREQNRPHGGRVEARSRPAADGSARVV